MGTIIMARDIMIVGHQEDRERQGEIVRERKKQRDRERESDLERERDSERRQRRRL